MDKVPGTYNLLRLHQEGIGTMNRPITSNKIKSVIKNKLQTNKSPGPESFTGEFYQTFKAELASILLKIFRKIEEKGKLLNSFYKANITPILKTPKK